MFNHLGERLRWPNGHVASLHAVVETPEGVEFDTSEHLVGFQLEAGLPVWTYEIDGVRFEKRVMMPYLQNTTHVSYRLLSPDLAEEIVAAWLDTAPGHKGDDGVARLAAVEAKSFTR